MKFTRLFLCQYEFALQEFKRAYASKMVCCLFWPQATFWTVSKEGNDYRMVSDLDMSTYDVLSKGGAKNIREFKKIF